MPWFNVDDKAHSHPKMIKAGNAAVGLWLRCGSYVAQHLTDGVVPGLVADMYGTTPQISKLVKVGLWHPHGHICPSCPQPAEGDYYMHDYHDRTNGNPLRAEVEQRRSAPRRRSAGSAGAATAGPAVRRGIARSSMTIPTRSTTDSTTIRPRKTPPILTTTQVTGVRPPGTVRGPRARVLHSPPLHSLRGG